MKYEPRLLWERKVKQHSVQEPERDVHQILPTGTEQPGREQHGPRVDFIPARASSRAGDGVFRVLRRTGQQRKTPASSPNRNSYERATARACSKAGHRGLPLERLRGYGGKCPKSEWRPTGLRWQKAQGDAGPRRTETQRAIVRKGRLGMGVPTSRN